MSDLSEVKALADGLNRAWEEFKSTNDARLAVLAKGESVADLEAKLAKMNSAMDDNARAIKDLTLASQRPDLSSDDAASQARELRGFNAKLEATCKRTGRPYNALSADGYAEYKAAVSKYIRGDEKALTAAEQKAINVGTDSEGGYLVGEEMENAIERVATTQSAMRRVCRVIQIGAASYKKIVKTTGVAAGGWAGETTAPSETTTQAWSELEFQPGTVWAEPRITQEALEDSVQDVEADLVEEIGITFAEQEGDAFIDGTGIKKPRGFLDYPSVANASYAWGSIGFIVSGAAAAFATTNPSDALIDLQHALKPTYRAGAVWVMNDATLGAIRKFKDEHGIYLWAPSNLMSGMVGQLLGHPVETDDYMPDLGTNAFPVAFGDFRRGYLIVDRRGVSVLRDPFTAKPYVKFYARKRVGGGVANFEAIKVLKCST